MNCAARARASKIKYKREGKKIFRTKKGFCKIYLSLVTLKKGIVFFFFFVFFLFF